MAMPWNWYWVFVGVFFGGIMLWLIIRAVISEVLCEQSRRNNILYAFGSHHLDEYIEERYEYLRKREQKLKGTSYFDTIANRHSAVSREYFIKDFLTILATCGVELTFIEEGNENIETATPEELEDFYENRIEVESYKNN